MEKIKTEEEKQSIQKPSFLSYSAFKRILGAIEDVPTPYGLKFAFENIHVHGIPKQKKNNA